MNTPEDLSPEQLVVWAILSRDHTEEVALRLVRDARFTAYALGAHLVPILEEMAGKLTEFVGEYQRIMEADR